MLRSSGMTAVSWSAASRAGSSCSLYTPIQLLTAVHSTLHTTVHSTHLSSCSPLPVLSAAACLRCQIIMGFVFLIYLLFLLVNQYHAFAYVPSPPLPAPPPPLLRSSSRPEGAVKVCGITVQQTPRAVVWPPDSVHYAMQ